MKLARSFFTLFSIAAVALANAVAHDHAVDPIMGDYSGRFIDPPKTYRFVDHDCVAQVVALGDNAYSIALKVQFDMRSHNYFAGEGMVKNGVLAFDVGNARGRIANGKLTGTIDHNDQKVAFELNHIIRKSVTLGAKPHDKAITLFDGSDFDEWEHTKHDKPIQWKKVGDAMQIVPRKKGQPNNNLGTKRKFRDVFLHMEFMTPYEPENRGQGRGNSGVYYQGAYETQVLDSYGLEGIWNETGSIYRMSPPRVNACLPPLSWQTYDVEYRGPRFDANGDKVSNARFTVYLNGVRVQHEFEVEDVTHGGAKPEPTEPRHIWIQDHSNPVSYRNIWVVDLEKHPDLGILDIMPELK